MTTYSTDEERRRPLMPIPTTRRGKVLFGLALVAWFALLMTPCMLFFLAQGGEVVLQHANVPEPHEHPLLRVNLVMDADNRGFQVTSSHIPLRTEAAVCVQMAVHYLMWETDETDTAVRYCDCYARDGDVWRFSQTTTGDCEVPQ